MLLVHIMYPCSLVLIGWMLGALVMGFTTVSWLAGCGSTLCLLLSFHEWLDAGFPHYAFNLIVQVYIMGFFSCWQTLSNRQLLKCVEKIYLISFTPFPRKPNKQSRCHDSGMSVPVSLSAHQSLVVSFAHDHWGSWNHRGCQGCVFLPLMLFVVPPGALLRAPCVFMFRCHLEPFSSPDTLKWWQTNQ